MNTGLRANSIHDRWAYAPPISASNLRMNSAIRGARSNGGPGRTALSHKILALAVAVLMSSISQAAFAQAGNNNPTGPAGQFNGNVTTAGSYDPYTGNVTRSITDIVVAGAVGQYGLSYTRTWNSRDGAGWRHSFDWTIQDVVALPEGQPIPYTVGFPDGRRITFGPPILGGAWRAGTGTRERFKTLVSNLCYLLLPDGGKVEFSATSSSYYDDKTNQTYYSYYFTARAIIDPYGLRTSFTYNADGSLTVTEPAGRWLRVYYGPGGVTSVEASDGRSVAYTYSTATFSPGTVPYTLLTQVRYFNDPTLDATYSYQGPNVGDPNGLPLLEICSDSMDGGPMKRIFYKFATENNPDGTPPVYGQIKSEHRVKGTAALGAAVSTLTMDAAGTRTETRFDGQTRTFTYNTATGLLTSATDFKGVAEYRAYDANRYLSGATDRRGYTTNFTNNSFTGGVTQVQFPAVTSATPAPAPRGTVATTFGWATCPDVNNRDANNPYYPYSITDEGGNTTIFTRDENKRVTRIDYPDGGHETFDYGYNPFGQVESHRLKTGGTETFTYNGSGQRLTWRDPENSAANPSARYAYDTRGRLSAICDVFGTDTTDGDHTTSFAYNERGQLTTTTLPTDLDDVRHTIVNVYNADGTLASVTDQRGKVTSYTYDEYRRLRTVTTPLRYAGDTTPRVTNFYYTRDQTAAEDLTHTDSNVTRIVRPSTNIVTAIYDENDRKISETASAADGTTDAATTSYEYDATGNLTRIVAPNQQTGQLYAGKSTIMAYDERNRPISITDALNGVTETKYDWAGRPKLVTRANGQTVVYDIYDSMNHLLQQTVEQAPNPNAVTKYTYDSTGLLRTMQDPRLVALNSTYKYTYGYDSLGRQTSLQYPPDSKGLQRTESSTFDAAGRLATFTNRSGKVKTFTYDELHRTTGFSWAEDPVVTPAVTFVYDVASRLVEINNANATITRTYFDDNLLKTETQTPGSGGSANTVTYSYTADGQRLTLQHPGGGPWFGYGYSGRNQLKGITNFALPVPPTIASFTYDVNGNLATRVPDNSTSSTYTYNALDRVMNISHALAGTTRTLDYDYDSVNRRKWQQRDAGSGDVFGYDLNDQVTAMLMNIANPQNTLPGTATITTDANGNRISFAPYGTTETYTTNNLNQYTARDSTEAAYDLRGNLTAFGAGTAYVYDAQNRLTSATAGGSTTTFKYDGLNRQVSRTVGGVTTYSVWDGWELIKEYTGTNTIVASYLSGPTGLVKDLTVNKYYYQDGSGSTSHLAGNTGTLLEWYRYDLQGTPYFFTALNDNLPGGTQQGVGFLFTGQRWMAGLGLYDLRNRFYSPDLGRFLQPDPIGFAGDPTNLYRYCGGDPVNRIDPSGLIIVRGDPIYFTEHKSGGWDPVDIFYAGDWGTNEQVMWSLGGGNSLGWLAGPGGGGSGAYSLASSTRISLFPAPTIQGQPVNPQLPPSPYPGTPVMYGPHMAINPYTLQPIMMPPGVSLSTNIAVAQSMSRVGYARAVTGPWNYKRQGAQYEPFGNFNAGMTGAAVGFSTTTIQRGAGWYQQNRTTVYDRSWGNWYGGYPYGDDPIDQFMVDWGARYYNGGSR